jgi:phage gp45-like
MAVPSISALFDVLTVKRSELLGDVKATIGLFMESSRGEDPDDPIELADDESAPVDLWQHYGFLSRPPPKSQSLVARVGANVFAIATRAVSAIKVFGQLGEGDVAVYSAGGNVIRLNHDGSISVIVPTEGGDQVVAQISHKGKGAIRAVVPPGLAFEMSEKNGITLNAGDKDVTIAGKQVQIVAQQFVNASGVVKLHAGAMIPIMVGGTGAIPIPNVYI